MQRRVCCFGIRVWFAALALLCVAPVFAQLPTTITISDSRSAVADALRNGQQLEMQRRWGEALTHYEEAIHQYPNEASLQQRFDSARFHYDLERRYADRSYCESILRLSTERSLDLYDQVLLKIDKNYVDVPHWRELVERGTTNLKVALSEPSFVNHNIPERDRVGVDAFCREIDGMIASYSVNDRAGACNMVGDIARLAQQRLEMNPTAVVLEFLCGATNTLDPYSTYLTPDQLTEVYSQIEGNYVGLGVDLKAINGLLVIKRVFPGSPAEEGGVRQGDRIMAIDRHPTLALTTDQALAMLPGADGTVVLLGVAGEDQQTRQLSIRRRRVEVSSIDQVGIIDRDYGVGYFKLTCFQKTTSRDLDVALWKLHRDGMKSLIMDLRGNPGGLLVSAVEVADRFIERGVIVSTHGRSSQEDFTYTAHEQSKWRIPLVVIIDQDSASAAEIFAGAIRDHHRGTIVGVRSFGKGSVQGIFPLDESMAGVRLTTAKFYSPTGRPYSRIGVEPDVVVPTPHIVAKPIDGRQPEMKDSMDSMLDMAVRAARGMMPVAQQARNTSINP